jgi:hypothetical protein
MIEAALQREQLRDHHHGEDGDRGRRRVSVKRGSFCTVGF